MQRAVNGSDNLLVFVLRARRQSMYRENHEAKAETPSQITVCWSSEGARPEISNGE